MTFFPFLGVLKKFFVSETSNLHCNLKEKLENCTMVCIISLIVMLVKSCNLEVQRFFRFQHILDQMYTF